MDDIRRHFPTEFHEWFSYFIHDIGKPLAIINQIIAPLEMLESSNSRVSRKEQIRIGREVRNNLTEMNAIITGVTNNLSLEGLVLQVEEVSLEESIRTVLKLVKGNAEAMQINISYQPEKEALLVKADSVLTRRVIRNIVDNAIEYTPPNGSIRIETAIHDGWVCVTISDTGPGIPESSMRWLFNPGFRVGGERRPDINGRGLGLAFVRKAIELQGGRISVDSKLGEGSRFTIELLASDRTVAPS